LEFNLIILMMF